MKLTVLFFTVYFFILLKITISWDLTPLGIKEDYQLLHVSLQYVRSFLSIRMISSSSSSNCNSISNNKKINNSLYPPTLIESTWPENLLAIKPKIFPNQNAHAENSTDCNKIIQAYWTDIDYINRLWLLDIGNEHCKSKLIIYDLINRNKELFRMECSEFHWNNVTSMRLDPKPTLAQSRAYFTLSHGQYLIVFHLRTKKWIKSVVKSSIATTTTTTNSGGNSNWAEMKIIPAYEIAFTLDHRLYISDNYGNLFIANVNDNNNNGIELEAKFLGSLLGEPKGLITDPAGVLYYILPKDGAIVRWEPSRTLNAEGHEILLFQSLNVIQIFFGIGGSVWIATENIQTGRDHCIRLLHYYNTNSNLGDFY